MNKSFEICGGSVAPGESKNFNLFVAKLFDYTDLNIPVRVVRGKTDGPTLFISAAIHGDEINGVEIIRRVLRDKSIENLAGTLVAVPIVNIFGFNDRTRYLPDRRDLNRSFPGDPRGSLAGRMAHLFFTEIVQKCTHGIDLHTAAIHRVNLPQVRIDTSHEESLKMAKAFRAPVILNSTLRDGSLRQEATRAGVPVILFEGGEALRVNEYTTRMGLKGVLSVMHAIGMVEAPLKKGKKSFIAKSSHWIRAPHSGTLSPRKRLGASIQEGDLLGIISDPFGEERVKVRAKKTGVIIGKSNLPLVNQGDALFHVATLENELVEDELATRVQDDLDYELLS